VTRILVIGRQGQTAQALASVGGAAVTCVGRPDVDLADPGSLGAIVRAHAPDVVINSAAYTAVDKAETEPDLARALNVDGPRALAEICAAAGIPLVHMSTDCVFDGALARPYRPGDAAAPLNVYGQSKLEGEHAVAAACARHLIVRVSWIFSPFASNFVRTMLSLAHTRAEVTVVNDQIGYPTHAPDLARGLLVMAAKASAPGFLKFGTYHLAGTGETDRSRMARDIFAQSAAAGGPFADVIGVATADYQTPARRALNARLDMSLTTAVFGVTLPDWRIGLGTTVPVLIEEMART
jgi:dTDP-4-dehydrorhamnose reductase